jgi:hypothetical protein
MSLIHPQIRTLQAIADALEIECGHLKLEAPADYNLVCRTLTSIAVAYRSAAEALRKEELELLERVTRTAL